MANTAYIVNGGVLDLAGFNLQMSSLAGIGGTIEMGAAALTVNQLANTTYAGVLSGSGALSKAEAGQLTLTGANVYTGDTTISGGTLQFGDGTVAATNNLGSDILVTAGNMTILTPTTVTVAGKLEMLDSTSLSIDTALGNTASFTAPNINLGNSVSFNLTGINATSQFEQMLIDTSAGISGDFATVSVSGFKGVVDYLTINTHKSTDGKQYLTTYDLAWSARKNAAHGNFTLTNAGDTFTVGTTLADQAGNSAINWDSKTPTKLGGDMLTLSGVNTYTGDTTVSGGTVLVNGSIASSSMTTVASGETLGGSGILSNTFIESGTTLAPGGVGTTLTVDGDLNIASGTT